MIIIEIATKFVINLLLMLTSKHCAFYDSQSGIQQLYFCNC